MSLDSDPAVEPRIHAPRQAGAPLAGLYVLVVDDDPHVADLFRVVLAYYGATVSIAMTASAARGALERMRADVVVCRPSDCARLLREGPDVPAWLPFIVISAEDVDTRVGTDVRFVAQLRKPMTCELLVDTVLAAVAQSAA